MKPESEIYVRIIVGILTMALLPTISIAYFGPDGWFLNLQNWQSGVGAYWGALFGLGAILIGALFNAKLGRDRDDRLREQETLALAAALAAEFDVIGHGISLLEAQVERQQEYNEQVPTCLWEPASEVFNGNTNSLGYLGANMANRVTHVLALATAASDAVKINWNRLADEKESADGIKKKIREISCEAEAVMWQLEEVARGSDPDEAIATFTTNYIAELKKKKAREKSQLHTNSN